MLETYIRSAPEGYCNKVTAELARSFGSVEQRWETITGENPVSSGFAFIIPIFHEKKHLPGVLKAVDLQVIPDRVATSYMFIINGTLADPIETSTDNAIVMDYISRHCDPQDIERISAENYFRQIGIDISTIDQGLICYEVVIARDSRANRSYTILNTTTAGKAGALNIGN